MQVLIGVVVGVALMMLIAVGLGWLRRARRIQVAQPVQPRGRLLTHEGESTQLPALVEADEMSRYVDLDIHDSNGEVLIQTREISGFTNGQGSRLSNELAVKSGQQLASDIFKGVTTLPGKTIEIVFDPKIQKGLQTGALEIMPAAKGGHYAIARDVGTKRTAGQGRVIQAGGARQLAAGMFHLASIAVAQAHLADINRNLGEIKTLVQDLSRRLDGKDLAELEGSLQYLQEMAAVLRDLVDPAELPSEKRNQLENMRVKAMASMAFIAREIGALGSKISSQKSKDNFGTGNTHSALVSLAEDASQLVARYQFTLRLVALIEICDTYLDPTRRFTSKETFEQGGRELRASLSGVLAQLRDRANVLLGQALFNSHKKLDARRSSILATQDQLLEQVVECHQGFDHMLKALSEHSDRVYAPNARTRMQLQFDDRGMVEAVQVR
jgi:hypothetical protein